MTETPPLRNMKLQKTELLIAFAEQQNENSKIAKPPASIFFDLELELAGSLFQILSQLRSKIPGSRHSEHTETSRTRQSSFSGKITRVAKASSSSEHLYDDDT